MAHNIIIDGGHKFLDTGILVQRCTSCFKVVLVDLTTKLDDKVKVIYEGDGSCDEKKEDKAAGYFSYLRMCIWCHENYFATDKKPLHNCESSKLKDKTFAEVKVSKEYAKRAEEVLKKLKEKEKDNVKLCDCGQEIRQCKYCGQQFYHYHQCIHNTLFSR